MRLDEWCGAVSGSESECEGVQYDGAKSGDRSRVSIATHQGWLVVWNHGLVVDAQIRTEYQNFLEPSKALKFLQGK